VDFRVEAYAGFADGLILRGSGAVGMLMEFAMSAVHEHGLRGVAGDQQVLKIFEIAVFGEAVEILVNGSPWAEIRGQSPPSTAIAQEIPEGIQMPVEIGRATECDYKVVASRLEFVDLIFLAAHGTKPA
jgi:hypothetical protein